jgi:hypothetical protein
MTDVLGRRYISPSLAALIPLSSLYILGVFLHNKGIFYAWCELRLRVQNIFWVLYGNVLRVLARKRQYYEGIAVH